MGNTFAAKGLGALDAGALIVEAQIVVHEADHPDVIGEFPDADGLTGKDLGEVAPEWLRTQSSAQL
jgi:hypothetical protein